MRVHAMAATVVAAATVFVAHPAHAWVQYCNESSKALFSMFSSFNGNSKNCNGNGTQLSGQNYYVESWEDNGWYYLTPGQCATVSSMNLANSYCGGGENCFQFHAQSADGEWIWDSGNQGMGDLVVVEDPAFDICDPFSVFIGQASVPSPYFEMTPGYENVGTNSNFTLNFN